MSVSTKRIAVLFHKQDRHYDPARYLVHYMAESWRSDGHEVIYLFGTGQFVPADLVLVHVNLSVVPDEYLELASRYPIALNHRVCDIRKSTISHNLVGPGDPWGGPVIVKSDLNYAGLPERVLGRSRLERQWPASRRVRRLVDRLKGDVLPFVESTDYEVFDNIAVVPQRWLDNPDVVVEKFLPEIENGSYHSRSLQFLGDRWTCVRLASPDPIVKVDDQVRIEAIEPHEEAMAWRDQLDLDYGKIDYVVCEGEVVLFDANKTTGAARVSDMSGYATKKRMKEQRRYRAEGLYSYF